VQESLDCLEPWALLARQEREECRESWGRLDQSVGLVTWESRDQLGLQENQVPGDLKATKVCLAFLDPQACLD